MSGQADNVTRLPVAPRIIARSEHIISRANISDNALKVLNRLNRAGFKGLLVGGGVRDLLLGREPKDFDVATDAHPEQIRELFRNCRLIGRRFRLAHVHFGREIIEVATFRAQHQPGADGATADGRIIRDNVYGALDDDVWRRDLTINALYYDIDGFSLVDYVGGMEDIKAGRIRLIGDPEQRYREDPVRMLRALRFAVKCGFTLDPATAAPLESHAELLTGIPAARLFDEVFKMFMCGSAVQIFESLRHYGLFAQLFPLAEASLAEQEGGFPHMLFIRALENTDKRISEGKPVTPTFLFAALLWNPLQKEVEEKYPHDMSRYEAMQLAGDSIISQQIARVSMPRKVSQGIREIWMMQYRLAKTGGKRAARLVIHPRFRAAYDFLVLRAQAGEPVKELADWWTDYQETDEVRQVMAEAVIRNSSDVRRRRRRRRA